MTAEVRETIPKDIEQVLANISDAFVTLDREWRCTFVNNKLAELAGMNKEDFLGRSIWELFPETVNSQLYTEVHRAVVEQIAVDFEYLHPIWHRWLENRVYPSENGVLILIKDITQRKRSQQLLAAQYGVTRILKEATTLANTVPTILQSLCESLGWQVGMIWSVEHQANTLQRIGVWYSSDFITEDFQAFQQCTTLAFGEGFPGQVWASSQPIWINELPADENFFATKGKACAAIGLPIQLGNKILGVIEFFDYQIPEPDAELLEMMSAIATQIAQFMEHKQTELLLQESEEKYRLVFATDINKRQQADEKLRHSEARYRSLAEASAAIVWTAAPWGNVIEDIPTWQGFTGQSPEQYRGWGWVDAVYSEDRKSIVEIWTQAFSERSVAVAEYRVRRHDGEYRYMKIRGVPILNEIGEIREWVGMCVDITERKQAEVERERLLEREQVARVEAEAAKEQITKILSSITDGFLAFDREWRFTYLNQEGSQTLGRPLAELLGKNLWEEFPELADSSFGQLYQRAVALGVPLELEDYYPPFNAWFLVRAYPSAAGLSLYFCNINARKQAEAAMRESEARFRLLAENSTDIISRHTVDGRLLYISPACYTVLGYQPEELIGHLSRELVHPDDLAEIAHKYPVNADLPDTYTITHRARHKDGDYIWLESIVRAIRNPQTREILEIQTSSRDITKRKQVEDRQRFLAQASGILASSLDYETILAALARLVVPEIADWCVVDIIGDNQSIRRVAAAHAEPAKQELVEQLQNYPPDLTQPEGIAEVLRSGKSQITHYIADEQMQAATHNADHLKVLQELAPKSGMTVPLIVRGRVLGAMTLTSSSGRRYDTNSLMLAEAMAGRAAIAVDNARLYAEAQRSQSRTARLQAITAALSESLTSIQVAEVIVDQGMAALGASSALVALVTKSGTDLEIIRAVGYQQEQIDTWRQFSINAPVPLAEAVRTGEPVWQEPTATRVARYSNLAQIYAQYDYGAWISIPLMLEGRAVGGMSLAFAETQEFSQDDHTFILSLAQQCAQALERARLYEAEQTAREAAETANRIKDEFLAVLSHELRSPLNPILGWSKLLQTKKLDEKTIPVALKTIERNAKLQAQLIEDLLDISRILQGKLSLNICPVDLISVISGAMETVRLSAEAKSIEIHTILEPNIGQVLGDSSRLQQIVWNLLSNAVKFTPGGGRVEIRLQQIGTQAEITVSDTGKGIDPDFLPYVFDYFRQENSSTTRKFGGLGLGLAIVRHLVELHGGTVQVQSQGEDQGATFTVRLPLIQNILENKQDTKESETTADLNNVKILIVDDDADTREFIAFLLEQYGANVTAVASANEALAALTESVPDVLLSDIGMPEMDGCMLIRQVRNLPPEQGGQIRAIALTAYAGQINEKQILAAGFHKHIAKPVEPAELVEAIASLLV